jgi:1-acyl-sn-glycerol-3-phosphate acyltransferase
MPDIKHATLAYNILINLVERTGGLFFSEVEEHFLHESKTLISPYPTAIVGNHVSEIDIAALAIVYTRLSPQIKMTIPAREDIMRRDFLTKEFRTRGLTKLILSLIDKSNIIPLLLGYIGCMPIKRPFRDNSRELLKKGELRETVDAEWNTLVENIDKGRNLFMFPEGTYNQDGFLNQIKKGVYYLKSKVDDVQFNSFNLTYDTLSFKKTKLHITYGTPFTIAKEDNADMVTKTIQDKIGGTYAITLGNLVSYMLLKLEESSLLSIDRFGQNLISFKNQIMVQHPELKIGSELRKLSDTKALESIFEKLQSLKYVNLAEGKVKILGALTAIPKTVNQLKKHNVVLYHKNQLTKHLEKLDKIFDQSVNASVY